MPVLSCWLHPPVSRCNWGVIQTTPSASNTFFPLFSSNPPPHQILLNHFPPFRTRISFGFRLSSCGRAQLFGMLLLLCPLWTIKSSLMGRSGDTWSIYRFTYSDHCQYEAAALSTKLAALLKPQSLRRLYNDLLLGYRLTSGTLCAHWQGVSIVHSGYSTGFLRALFVRLCQLSLNW